MHLSATHLCDNASFVLCSNDWWRNLVILLNCLTGLHPDVCIYVSILKFILVFLVFLGSKFFSFLLCFRVLDYFSEFCNKLNMINVYASALGGVLEIELFCN